MKNNNSPQEVNSFDKCFEKYFGKEVIDEIFYKKIVLDKSYRETKFSAFGNFEKLLKTIMTSLEIKFGNYLEDLFILICIQEAGLKEFESESKNIDLLLTNEDNRLYIGEIKKRDNHDSTKWKGQIMNLNDKYTTVKTEAEFSEVAPILFFIDDKYVKNKDKYGKEWKEDDDLKIVYGKKITEVITEINSDHWDMFIDHVEETKNKLAEMMVNYTNASDEVKTELKNNLATYIKDSIGEMKREELIKRINEAF